MTQEAGKKRAVVGIILGEHYRGAAVGNGQGTPDIPLPAPDYIEVLRESPHRSKGGNRCNSGARTAEPKPYDGLPM